MAKASTADTRASILYCSNAPFATTIATRAASRPPIRTKLHSYLYMYNVLLIQCSSIGQTIHDPDEANKTGAVIRRSFHHIMTCDVEVEGATRPIDRAVTELGEPPPHRGGSTVTCNPFCARNCEFVGDRG